MLKVTDIYLFTIQLKMKTKNQSKQALELADGVSPSTAGVCMRVFVEIDVHIALIERNM